jgi:hypothetical protein
MKLACVLRGRIPSYPFQERADRVGLRDGDTITDRTVDVTDVECDGQIAAHSVGGARGYGLSALTRGVTRGWGEGHKEAPDLIDETSSRGEPG